MFGLFPLCLMDYCGGRHAFFVNSILGAILALVEETFAASGPRVHLACFPPSFFLTNPPFLLSLPQYILFIKGLILADSSAASKLSDIGLSRPSTPLLTLLAAMLPVLLLSGYHRLWKVAGRIG